LTVHYRGDGVELHHGDCLDVLATLPDNNIDAVVTDPPYGLEFMGKHWDTGAIAFDYKVWRHCLRVLKPGGHLLAFGGTRTWHRLACAIEDAGFEIRDSIAWLYGSGFPKSLDVSKAFDRAAGELAPESVKFTVAGYSHAPDKFLHTAPSKGYIPPQPVTDAAKQWQGWGTALKPAHEPIIVARKPLEGTVAANVLAWGTGALNIDACRIGVGEPVQGRGSAGMGYGGSKDKYQLGEGRIYGAAGRWPTNVVLDETQAAELDKQSGFSKSPPIGSLAHTKGGNTIGTFAHEGREPSPNGHGDSSGASRFFPTFKYEPKAPSTERPNYAAEGETRSSYAQKRCRLCGKQPVNSRPSSKCRCDAPDLAPDPAMLNVVSHPTVKPVDLMRWLIRLVTPPGGTVLDPFAGSGTTGEAAIKEHKHAILIEREDTYVPLIVARLCKPMAIGFNFDEESA